MSSTTVGGARLVAVRPQGVAVPEGCAAVWTQPRLPSTCGGFVSALPATMHQK